MRGRVSIAAALLATAVAVVPAAASPDGRDHGRTGTLNVSAAHTASTTWRLHEAVSIHSLDYAFELPRSVLDFDGEYGALLVYQKHRLLFGLLGDRALPFPLTWGIWNPKLKPGTYTVVLAGDGPVRVHLPLDHGTTDYALSATDGAHARRVSAQGDHAGLGNVERTSQRLRFRQGSAVVLAYVVKTDSGQVSDSDLCLVPTDEICGSRDEIEGMNVMWGSPGSVGDGYSGAAMFSYPGDIPAGSYYEVGNHADIALSAQSVLTGYVFG